MNRVSSAIPHLLCAAALALFGCAPASPPAQRVSKLEVYDEFSRECAKRGIVIGKSLGDGRYEVFHRGNTLLINLENLNRDYLRDHDRGAVEHFVDVLADSPADDPSWSDAAPRLRLCLEPSDTEFGDSLHRPVTNSLVAVLAYVDLPETRIRWITPRLLELWGVQAAAAWRRAEENMEALIAGMPLVIDTPRSMKLGYFDSASILNASMILSPGFKAAVSEKLGWPVYAVVPCRDYMLVFSDKALIPHLGTTVVKEYKSSGHPLTAEVLRISDAGITAVDAFSVDANKPKSAAPAL